MTVLKLGCAAEEFTRLFEGLLQPTVWQVSCLLAPSGICCYIRMHQADAQKHFEMQVLPRVRQWGLPGSPDSSFQLVSMATAMSLPPLFSRSSQPVFQLVVWQKGAAHVWASTHYRVTQLNKGSKIWDVDGSAGRQGSGGKQREPILTVQGRGLRSRCHRLALSPVLSITRGVPVSSHSCLFLYMSASWSPLVGTPVGLDAGHPNDLIFP